MWIVRLALRRPYTFVVLALLIAVLGVVSVVSMPIDIFPEINIPVVNVIWSYSGLSPTEMQDRIVTVSERAYTTTVQGLEHLESVSLRGIAVTRLYFQPNVPIAGAIAQVNAQANQIVRQLPPGIFPPLIIQYNAASVPVVLASLSSDVLAEQQLNDLGNNFIRPQLVTVPGAAIPAPYGGKVRVVNVDIDPDALYARGLSPQDTANAIFTQNVIRPAGHHRRRSRGGHRGRPHGGDDPAVPGVVAEHADRRHVDPALDPDLDHHAQDPAPIAERDDPRRDGAGRRHPRGRRHGGDREQSPADGAWQAAAAGHPRRRGRGGHARVRRDALDLHRVRADPLSRRCGRSAVRAAGDVRRVRHARQLFPLAHARAHHGAVPAGARGARARESGSRPRRSGAAITLRAHLRRLRGRLPDARGPLRGCPGLGTGPHAHGHRRLSRVRGRLAVPVPIRRARLLPDRRCRAAAAPRQDAVGDSDRGDGAVFPASRGLYPPGDSRQGARRDHRQHRRPELDQPGAQRQCHGRHGRRRDSGLAQHAARPDGRILEAAA